MGSRYKPFPDMSWLAGKSVLVTGATGFIGSHLCTALVHAGADVYGASQHGRLSASGEQWLDGLQDLFALDLSDEKACFKLVADTKPDYIFHLASLVKGAQDADLIYQMFVLNTNSTVYLMEAARRQGITRMITAGSIEEPIAADAPSSPYAASKKAAQILGQIYQSHSKLDVVQTQIAMCYGPNQKDRVKLVPYVIRCLLDGQVPKLTTGLRRADWIYIDDVVEGLLRVAKIDTLPTAPIHLGTGTLTSIQSVVQLLCGMHDTDIKADFGAVESRRNETENAADMEALAAALNWSPGISLQEGLAKTYVWYQQRDDSSAPIPGTVSNHPPTSGSRASGPNSTC